MSYYFHYSSSFNHIMYKKFQKNYKNKNIVLHLNINIKLINLLLTVEMGQVEYDQEDLIIII